MEARNGKAVLISFPAAGFLSSDGVYSARAKDFIDRRLRIRVPYGSPKGHEV